MKQQISEEQAETIVDMIIDDLCDRRGLRQEWEQIDSSIQAEIRQQWKNLVMA